MKRILLFLSGLFIFALGTSVSITANLGISPVSSLPYVLSMITKIDQGIMQMAIFLIFIVLQLIILNKDFKKEDLIQVPVALASGLVLTFWNTILGNYRPESYILRFATLLVSIFLISIGVAMMITSRFSPAPPDAFCIAVSKKTNIPVHKVKNVLDVSFVAFSSILTFLILGKVVGIREGTVISALSIGPVLGILKPKVEKMFFHAEKLSKDIK